MKLTAVALASLLLSLIPVSAFSQWHWAHPQPQGHTLRDVVFLDDNTAIAVGDVGTILVTHDTGNSWTVLPKVLGLTSTLNSIASVNATTAVAVGDNGVVLLTPNLGANWIAVTPVVNPGNLTDVSFGDDTHGIAAGSNLSMYTINGGFSWQTVFVSPQLRSVDMVSATEGFAVGSGQFNLQHTVDGGQNWSPASAPTSGNPDLQVVDFLDAQHGAIATPLYNPALPILPTCFVTSDGGTTWTSSSLNSGIPTMDYAPEEILYAAPGEIMVAGKVQCCTTSAFDPPATGNLDVSINSGSTFTAAANGRPMFGLARNSADVALIVGQNGRMLRRSAGGSITTIGGPPPSQGYALFDNGGSSSFFNSQVGVVLNDDGYSYQQGGSSTYFAVTHDGGQTWIHPTGTGQCNDVVCLSATEMIGVGSGVGPIGAVLRSTNGGTSWSNIWGQSSPSTLTAIAAGSSTHAVAVGNGGNALVIDSGVVSVVATGGASFDDVAFASSSVVLAVGGTDKRSTDGGVTWASTVGPSTNVVALDFATPVTAFGITSTGILRSDDTGNTWTAIPSGAVSGLKDISFSDSDHGMAVGSQILVTSNGGTTWGPIEQPTTYPLNHVTMISPDLAFVSGTQSILFRFGELPVPTLIRNLDVAAVPFGAELRWDVLPDNSLAGFSITRSSGAARATIASNLAVTTRSFRDQGLAPGTTYEYQLVAIDRDGSYTQSMPVTVSIPKAALELLPNQPNPFNPETTIRFIVPERVRVTLTVHDVAGRVVATLVDDVRDPGMQTITWNAQGIASGVYFAKLRAGKTEVSRKMVLLK